MNGDHDLNDAPDMYCMCTCIGTCRTNPRIDIKPTLSDTIIYNNRSKSGIVSK